MRRQGEGEWTGWEVGRGEGGEEGGREGGRGGREGEGGVGWKPFVKS